MKDKIDRSKLPKPSVLIITLDSPDWVDKSTPPTHQGWYATRTSDGYISWRCWGNGGWWKQLRDGWIQSYTVQGEAMDYDWIPSTRRSVELDVWVLPTL